MLRMSFRAAPASSSPAAILAAVTLALLPMAACDSGAGAGPRVGYMAESQFLSDPENDLHVFDSANGTDPILSTGDTLGSHTFTARPFTMADMELADHDQVVVVGNTTGPDVAFGEAPGVWRFDPRFEPKLKLVLYEGGMVPGPTGELGTIGTIYSVNVNRDGQIAAEVTLDGAPAVIIEERRVIDTGVFRVAVKKGDDVPTRSGPRELIDLMRRFEGFRAQLTHFARQTLLRSTQGSCVDLLGEGNLLLTWKGGVPRMLLIDYGIFDLGVIRKTSSSTFSRIQSRLSRFESLLESASTLTSC